MLLLLRSGSRSRSHELLLLRLLTGRLLCDELLLLLLGKKLLLLLGCNVLLRRELLLLLLGNEVLLLVLLHELLLLRYKLLLLLLRYTLLLWKELLLLLAGELLLLLLLAGELLSDNLLLLLLLRTKLLLHPGSTLLGLRVHLMPRRRRGDQRLLKRHRLRLSKDTTPSKPALLPVAVHVILHTGLLRVQRRLYTRLLWLLSCRRLRETRGVCGCAIRVGRETRRWRWDVVLSRRRGRLRVSLHSLAHGR